MNCISASSINPISGARYVKRTLQEFDGGYSAECTRVCMDWLSLTMDAASGNFRVCEKSGSGCFFENEPGSWPLQVEIRLEKA
jgi:hypothetical protein